MIRVSFLIEDKHAGRVITLLDKVAIELAMVPVKASAKVRGTIRSQVAEAIAKLAKGDVFEGKVVRDWLRSWDSNPNSTPGILAALEKNKTIKRLAKGKYRKL